MLITPTATVVTASMCEIVWHIEILNGIGITFNFILVQFLRKTLTWHDCRQWPCCTFWAVRCCMVGACPWPLKCTFLAHTHTFDTNYYTFYAFNNDFDGNGIQWIGHFLDMLMKQNLSFRHFVHTEAVFLLWNHMVHVSQKHVIENPELLVLMA